jgi:hypothetical protein
MVNRHRRPEVTTSGAADHRALDDLLAGYPHAAQVRELLAAAPPLDAATREKLAAIFSGASADNSAA